MTIKFCVVTSTDDETSSKDMATLKRICKSACEGLNESVKGHVTKLTLGYVDCLLPDRRITLVGVFYEDRRDFAVLPSLWCENEPLLSEEDIASKLRTLIANRRVGTKGLRWTKQHRKNSHDGNRAGALSLLYLQLFTPIRYTLYAIR